LPLPYNETTLARVCEHIDRTQSALGMKMLLENPSTYVTFASSTMDEIAFLTAVTKRSGCGLLLDVSNVHVCATNQGFDPMSYVDRFPLEHVGEIHLAGFAEDRDANGAPMLIDSHSTRVADRVWALYRRVLHRIAPIPTLIEWDNDVPPFPILAGEVARAKAAMRLATSMRGSRLAA
jgi:uncharacterized protein (UPF0276 family)